MLCRYPKTLAAALAVCLSAASAADLSDPNVLVHALQAHRLQHPAPTPTAAHRFIKRQTTATPTYTVTGAPDSTCGFLSGSPGNAITCENSGICNWESDHVTAIMCQSRLEIDIKLACIERSVATDEVQCDDICQSNEFNLLCTESDAPFCRTYQYPGGIRDYRCASTTVTRIQSVDFTYSNQRDREFSTYLLGDESEATSTPSTTSEEEDPTSTPEPDTPDPTSDETPSDTASPSPSPPPAGGGGGGGGTNIGAIVGGTVGGVALLAAIAFGIYFMRRRSSKDKAQQQQQQQQPPMAGAGGPPPPFQPQPQPYPSNPGSPADGYGWKGGMSPPVQSPVAGSPPTGQPPYDAVSDVSRMSHLYSPTGTQAPSPMQQAPIYEAGSNPAAAGHHRGQLHEMQ